MSVGSECGDEGRLCAWDHNLGREVSYGAVPHGADVVFPFRLLNQHWLLQKAVVKLAWLLNRREVATYEYVGLGLSGSLLAYRLAEADNGFSMYVGSCGCRGGRGLHGHTATGDQVMPVALAARSGKMIADGVRVVREETYVVKDVACVIDCEWGASAALSEIGVRLHSLFTQGELLNWEDEAVRRAWAARMEER